MRERRPLPSVPFDPVCREPGARDRLYEHPEFGTVGVGPTGAIARIGMDGQVDRVVEGLPSAGSPGEAIGPMDVAFTGNHPVRRRRRPRGRPEPS